MTIFRSPITTKELIDQVLHAVWGGVLVWLFSINIPLVFAFILSMLFGVGREIVYQHWMTCSEGCRTDLLGWYIGCLISFALVVYI